MLLSRIDIKMRYEMRKTQMQEEEKEPSTFFEELDILDFRDDMVYK